MADRAPTNDPANFNTDPHLSQDQDGQLTQEDGDALGYLFDDDDGVNHGVQRSIEVVEYTQNGNVMSPARQPIEPRAGSWIDDDTMDESHVDDVSETFHPQQDGGLFVPDERLLSATPGHSTQQSSSSRMAPPPAPSPQAGVLPNASVFSKIRLLQEQRHKDKRTVSNPARAAQPSSSGGTFLDDITSRASGSDVHLGEPSLDEHAKADREAKAKYQTHKKHYDTLKKKRGGALLFAEEIEWIKIHRAEMSRQEKRKRDLAIAQEDIEEANHSDASHNDNEVPESDSRPDSSSKPRKKVTPANNPLQEAELRAMRVALQAEDDAPVRKKRKAAGASDHPSEPSTAGGKGRARTKGSKSKAPASSSASGAKAGARKATAKEKKAMEKAVRMGTSLMFSDVFRQQASQSAPREATFATIGTRNTRNKQVALRELIASVPIEHQKSARDDKAALLRASRDFDGHGTCRPAEDGMWMVKGMKTTLKNYQVMGTAFMRRRETATDEPKGGLMADQMGLGKTLMMLANIVNARVPRDAESKTTLLVASPALLTQWASEIQLHTDRGLEVMRYTSGTRLDSTNPFGVMKSHDIILTTYHEVMKSMPKNDPPIHCQTAKQKMDWWATIWEENRGPLHRMMFYRVVLDEAQSIKNHSSRTSMACRALMAKHKWALSGTPILNALDELYPYFKFLDVPHTGSFKIFKHNYTDPNDPENIDRLLARLSQFMIRRDHSDILFNKPILKLPRASKMTHWCTFNPVERSIYEIVRQRFAKLINFHAKKGDMEKSYNNALVMLLRLRQLTAHILMLQNVMSDLLEQEDIEKIRAVVHLEANSPHDQSGNTIRIVREQLNHLEIQAKKRSSEEAAKGSKGSMGPKIPSSFNENGEEEEEEEERDIEELLDDSPPPGDATGQPGGDKNAIGRSFGKTFDFRPYLNSLTTGDNWEKVKERATCCGCSGRPTNAWLTSCGHLMCGGCYEVRTISAAEGHGQARATCPACATIFEHANQLNSEEVAEIEEPGPATRSRKKQHSRRVVEIEKEEIAEDWLAAGQGVLPSAKTVALKAQLLNWFEENPKVKIIIYTQFLAMIQIMKRMCQEEGWGSDEYHGKMSQKSRDSAIKNLADNPNVRVLLASLRCGGLGLNLTMASRVVILDPWWNSASEQQAFCRVFRFGQKEPTYLTRFCVKNSVDERLIQMQERKEKEIDAVMQDDGSRVRKMSTRDLMRLFGNIGEDDSGRPYILIDNVDSRPGFHADQDHEGFADEL